MVVVGVVVVEEMKAQVMVMAVGMAMEPIVVEEVLTKLVELVEPVVVALALEAKLVLVVMVVAVLGN